jgi:hypothetical protein
MTLTSTSDKTSHHNLYFKAQPLTGLRFCFAVCRVGIKKELRVQRSSFVMLEGGLEPPRIAPLDP